MDERRHSQPGVNQAQVAIDAKNQAAPPQEQPHAQPEVQATPNAEPAPVPTSLSEDHEAAGKKFVDLKKRLEEVKRQTALIQKRLDEVTKNVREVKNYTRDTRELMQKVNDNLKKAQKKREQTEIIMIEDLQRKLKDLRDETKRQKRMSDLEKTIQGLQNGLQSEIDHEAAGKKFVELKKRLEKVKRQTALIQKRLDKERKKDTMKSLEEVKSQTVLIQERLDKETKKVTEVKKSTTELMQRVDDDLKKAKTKREQIENKAKAKIKELQRELKDLQDEEKKRQKRMSDLERTIQLLQNGLQNEIPLAITDADLMWMKVALTVASRAEISEYAKEKPNVGCVICRSKSEGSPEVLAVGWNGFLPNTPEDILKDTATKYDCEGNKHGLTKELALHAEINALRNCSEKPEKATVYVTHVPCYQCAKQLVSYRVKRVFYLFWMEYSESSVKLFKNFDISCIPFLGGSRYDVLHDFRENFLFIHNICEGSTSKAIPKKGSFHLSEEDSKKGTCSDLKRSVSGDESL